MRPFHLGSLLAGLLLLNAGCGEVASGADAQVADASVADAQVADVMDPSGATESIVEVTRAIDMRRANESLTTSFASRGGQLLVLASASGRRTGTGRAGFEVKIDGETRGGGSMLYRDGEQEAETPKTLVSDAALLTLPAGKHTLAVVPATGTLMGATDFVDVTVLELGKASAIQVLDQHSGPFPTAATLATGGRAGLLWISASAARAEQGLLQLAVELDGTPVGTLKVYTNVGNSHRALTNGYFVLSPSAGEHQLEIAPIDGTVMDADDRVDVLWLEPDTDVKLTEVLDQKSVATKTGPATVASGELQTSGGKVLLLGSGSALGTQEGEIAAALRLGDTVVGRHRTVAGGLHRTLVPGSFAITGLAAGTHPFSVDVEANTSADTNDYFSVTAIELPAAP